MEKKPLIILTGPTAVGKSALSISLAKAINGACLSADSVQVYKKLDIGSAKITPEEMQGVEHYLIDKYEPDFDYNIAQFKSDADEAIESIYSKNQIPIVVGGTGFYIHALVYDSDFSDEEKDDSIRAELEAVAASEGGVDKLYEMLRQIDPKSTETIHKNNVKRVIRAISFYRLHGKCISEFNASQKEKESPYNFAYFVLDDDRAKLYERIDKRVDAMLDLGLVDEVESLKKLGLSRKNTSMMGLGYKEILDALDGLCSIDEAIDKIKLETRHFAKRQLTWFNREKDVIRIYKPDFDYNEVKILEFMEKCLKEKGIYERNN